MSSKEKKILLISVKITIKTVDFFDVTDCADACVESIIQLSKQIVFVMAVFLYGQKVNNEPYNKDVGVIVT